ncbi:MAG: cation transporter [Gemmatimonadaceae bacterium]
MLSTESGNRLSRPRGCGAKRTAIRGAVGAVVPAPLRARSASGFAHNLAPFRKVTDRATLVRRGLWLSAATIALSLLEAVVALIAGMAARSVVLVGFGADSLIEFLSGAVAFWRLQSDADEARRERAERVSLTIIGASFLGLALYVTADSVWVLVRREPSHTSPLGMAITALSVVTMPLLARAKRHVARGMQSGALAADATQTSLCAYLSTIALVGVVTRATVGWWWADPLAALIMVPIIAKEGVEGLRGRDACADDSCR